MAEAIFVVGCSLFGEIDLGGFAVSGVALEVFITVVEAGHVGPDAVGKLADVDVVVFEDLVVALAFYGDAVFGSGELVGEAGELLVTLEVGVLLLQAEEGSEGYVELGVGVDVAGVVASCGEDPGAGVGDVGEDGGLFGDVAFDGGDEVGDKVEPALLHDVDLREGLVDSFVLLHQGVLSADVAASDEEEHHNDESNYAKHDP
jgi:hypothetical protein